MKKCSLLLAISFMALVFGGCSEEDESYLLTDVTVLTFENGGGSLTFSIESNTNWVITTTDEWISMTPANGTGNKIVTVSVADQMNIIMVEGKLTIRTGDGTKMLNLTVQIKGNIPDYPPAKDRTLTLSNTSNYMNFSGAAHEGDSLLVLSNIVWEVKGPEWIEAWDGERWRPLSFESGVIYGKGDKNIPIRTVDEYNGDELREGSIVISERLTGNYSSKIDVRQAGKYIVLTNKIVALSDGIGMNWKCGNGVKSFYYNVSEKPNSVDNIILDDVKTKWKKATPGSGAGWVGLKANTFYYITTITEESLNSDHPKSFTFAVKTPSEQNQPIVNVKDIILYDNIWYAETEMNEYTFAYIILVGKENDVWVTYNPPLLALYMARQSLLHKESFPIWLSSGYIAIMESRFSPSEIHCATWGMDREGQTSSTIKHFVKRLSGINGAPNTNLYVNKPELRDFASSEEMERRCPAIVMAANRKVVW